MTKQRAMKRYLIPILIAILVLTPVLLESCSQKTETPDSQIYTGKVLEFARAIRLVEKDRNTLMTEHENFSEHLMDMPTATVFQETDDFVNRSGKLRERIVSIKAPEVESAFVTHANFMVAYAVEHKAYSEWRTAVQSADQNKLSDAEELFYQAEKLFHAAYAEMNKMLKEFGLKWQDTE